MLVKPCIALARVLAFAFVAGLVAYGPIATAVAEDWTLGSRRFSTNAAMAAAPLRLTSTGRSSLTAFRFVGRVGGVSFEAVAQPDQSLTGKSIELAYDPSRADGSRLVVRVGSTVLRTNIPDWQLRPIVEFADSPYNAVVSLFGEGPEPKKYYYPQYHDAMKDTLMGMRVLQADILFMSLDQHWRIPRYDGKLLLGAGEQDSRERPSMDAARKLNATLVGHKWRSWVLTDTGTQPTFGAVNGELVVRAKPYYYFWNVNEKENDALAQARNQLVDEHNRLIASAKANINGHNGLVAAFNGSSDAERRRTLRAQMDQLQAEIHTQEANIKALRARIDSEQIEPKVFEVTDVTTAMRTQDGALAAYNPAVYSAYQRLAQYASFFRYAKNNNSANWQSFRRTIANVSVQPSVKTPTAWEREQR
jgi:hypothetical protein